MKNVKMVRQVFDKTKFSETINTKFNQLVSTHLFMMLIWLHKKIFGYYMINTFT